MSDKKLASSAEKPVVFFSNLDGLRFFCFLAVFFFHSFHTEYEYIRDSPTYIFFKLFIFKNGNLGVNFFFVLSGFLITYLLIKEREFYGRINIINFWKRRILRIWPLFFACLVFGFIIFPQIKILFGQQPKETANPLYYITFLNNFDLLDKGLPDASVLGVLWSVAIEEQFYFLWPILLSLIPINYYKYLFTAIILMTLFFRGFYDSPMYNEYHTLSCIGDMTVGGFGAVLMQDKNKILRIETLSKGFIIGLYFVVLLIFLFREQLLLYYPVRIGERIFIATVFLMVILEQSYARESLFKAGNFKTISKLGTITYGLYCLHFIGILIATNTTKLLHLNTQLWQVLVLDTAIALIITIIIGMVSYRYFESPFLKLKNKLSYIRTP